MQLSEKDITQLEELWNGQLKDEEKTILEKRLAEDVAFRKAAEEWQMIIQEAFVAPAEEQKELDVIKERLLNFEKDQNKETSKSKNNRRPLLYLTIAAAIILILIWLIFFNSSTNSSSSVQAYFTHLSRDNANLSDDRSAGEKAYDQKEYEKAYSALLEEVKQSGDSLNLIYAGVAAVGSGQADKAISILEPLTANENWTYYLPEIKWYLALAYLDKQEIEKAKPILEELAKTNNEYNGNANNILNEIKLE